MEVQDRDIATTAGSGSVEREAPLGAAVAVLLLVALVAIIVASNRIVERRYAEVFR